MHIDANGDAEGNYTVITLQHEMSGVTAANSLSKMSMQSVGYFVYSKQTLVPVNKSALILHTSGKLSISSILLRCKIKVYISLQEFRYIKPDRSILWLKGRPPLAEPLCGYHGELCRKKKLDWRYVTSGSFFGLFVIIAGIFLIK